MGIKMRPRFAENKGASGISTVILDGSRSVVALKIEREPEI
jgi:hypothetical protein